MNFLCPKHRQQFAPLPTAQKLACWLDWLERAVVARSQDQWQEVVAHAGCAFELISMGQAESRRPLHVELTLTAIFLCNTFSALGDRSSAMGTIDIALEKLETQRAASAGHDSQCTISECMSALRDGSKHQQFFMDYFNWPLDYQMSDSQVFLSQARSSLH